MTSPTSNTPSVQTLSSYKQVLEDFISKKRPRDSKNTCELQLDANYHGTDQQSPNNKYQIHAIYARRQISSTTFVWIFLSHRLPRVKGDIQSVKGNIQSVKLHLKHKGGQSCTPALMNPIELLWSTDDMDDSKSGNDFIVRSLLLPVREDYSDVESSKAGENLSKRASAKTHLDELIEYRDKYDVHVELEFT